MVLSLVPCEDVYELPASQQAQLITTVEDAHSKDKGDICSPLCFCNCCQITVTSFKIEPLVKTPYLIKAYLSKKILFQKNNFAYQVYDHIWQPPKI